MFQLYRAISFIGWRNRSTRRNPTELSQVTNKLYHIMLYRVYLVMDGIRTHNFGGESNYHTITTKTAPCANELDGKASDTFSKCINYFENQDQVSLSHLRWYKLYMYMYMFLYITNDIFKSKDVRESKNISIVMFGLMNPMAMEV